MVRSALAVLVAAPFVAGAAEPAGRAVTLRGDIKVKHAHDAAAPTDTLKLGDEVHQGDTITTNASAAVRFLMRDKSLVDLGPHSQITVSAYAVQISERKRSARLHMWFGRLWTRVSKSLGSERDYEVTTPNAVAGVRGTEFVVNAVEGGPTEITVIEGEVEVGASAGGPPGIVGAMQRGTVGTDGAVSVAPAAAGEIQQLVDSLKPGGSLDDGQTDDRLQGAGVPSGAGEPSGAPPEQAPPADMPLPEIDPSSSDTRVRGKLEVKP